MTRHSVTDDDYEAVARDAAAQVLRDEGGQPGHSIHSWRCEYTDTYGPCDCVEQVTAWMLAAAAPHIAARARTEALDEAATAWQLGAWADAPRHADRVQERIATAQHVTDWLRARAAGVPDPTGDPDA